MSRQDIVKETIRRFYHLGNLTIAKYLIDHHGALFDFNLEKARSAVRYFVGQSGADNRHKAVSKELFKDPPKPIKSLSVKRHPYILKPGTWLHLSDVHIPFHSQKALEVAFAHAKEQNVTGVLLNGDIFDYEAISFWEGVKRDFDKEIEMGIDFLDLLRYEFPDAEIVLAQGNHDFRVARYFAAKAPELANTPFAAMEFVLGLDYREIDFVTNHRLIKAGDLNILHGDAIRCGAASPAKSLFTKTHHPTLVGHYHRSTTHSERVLGGSEITCWTIGCLCGMSPDYAPFNQWNWGFAIIEVSNNGNFEVVSRRISDSGKVS